MSAHPPFDLEHYREIRQCLKALAQECGTYVAGLPDGEYARCYHCFGTGPWVSAIRHGIAGGTSRGRPCHVPRARALLDVLIPWIEGQEPQQLSAAIIEE